MAGSKTQKIVVRRVGSQPEAPKKQMSYVVEKLTNRTEPRVGTFLSEFEVDKLISGSKATVEVLAAKK